ncbi:hypothetical protein ANN_07425 [Periplaneta americana]|uniref:Homeobox domain-containing protein n=1 Tax=Periplaneta americana TaxID=6978 RepID=A0ABQ8SYK3_PERAM|nr:hypothetical protein ANN_07425 [Periplaneta americana]
MSNARLIPFEDLSLVTILPIMHMRYLSDYAMNYLALERKRPMQTSVCNTRKFDHIKPSLQLLSWAVLDEVYELQLIVTSHIDKISTHNKNVEYVSMRENRKRKCKESNNRTITKGIVKDIVYSQKSRNIDDLRVTITQALQQITSLMLQRTWAELHHRYELCRIIFISSDATVADPLLHANGPPLFGYAGIGSGTSIAKPIPRPAAAMFNPHLHTLLACRHPYLTVCNQICGFTWLVCLVAAVSTPNSGGSGGPGGSSGAPTAVFPLPGTFPWANSSRGKPRRGMMRRAVFSDLQRKGLEKRFQIQKYISKPDRKKLAEKLGLKDSQARTTFH